MSEFTALTKAYKTSLTKLTLRHIFRVNLVWINWVKHKDILVAHLVKSELENNSLCNYISIAIRQETNVSANLGNIKSITAEVHS